MSKKKSSKPRREPTFERWHDGLTEKERRVDAIAQRMQSGSWLTGVSQRALAKEWNVAPNTIEHLAAEASRVVRRNFRESPEAKEAARAQVLQTFEVIRAKAMALNDAQGLRVALDATRAFGFYIGVEPAKQLDVREREPDFFDGWTPEEKLAYANSGARPRKALKRIVELEVPALPKAEAEAMDREWLEPEDGQSGNGMNGVH